MPSPGKLRIQSQRRVTRYELVRGPVVKHLELEIWDIDAEEWKIAGRTTEDTNKTKSELLADLTTDKDEIVTLIQSEIDKVTAL